MNALFLGTSDDVEYLPNLKHLFGGTTTFVVTQPVEYLTMLETYCAKRSITKIVSTNTIILSKLLALQGNSKIRPSLSDYQGSLFSHKDLEIVFINPLRQLFTVPYGKFIAERFISKVTDRDQWQEPTAFNWELLTPRNIDVIYARYRDAYAIACDIETFRNPPSIRCIGFTAVFLDSQGNLTSHSCVLPIDSIWALEWMRRFCALDVQKIFQNGKYDTSYLLRYNSAPTNWYWDTANLFHCWYSELPKDLAFLNAFFLRKVVYWKDLAETNDLHEYYRYNALDTWATANVWIQQLRSMPDWARRNYLLEFPLVYPCLLAEMTGLLRDQIRLGEQRNVIDAQIEKENTSLRRITGAGAFNTNSPVQVKQLLSILGYKDAPSTDEKTLQKYSYGHPLAGFILSKILKVRGLRKLASTYLRLDSDAKVGGIHDGEGGAKEFNGRVLYSLNPHGTDTGRLASREHHFWCGLQIQNIPVGPEVKSTICADDGFYIAEADLEQAESRDTAYISGDIAYIAAVTGVRDFHSVNASAFFGISYVALYSDERKKTLNKPIRDLSKRTNHGANYNMGPDVLVDTMGLANVYQARTLLRLTATEPRKITAYLLERFHGTYPGIKGRDFPYSAGTYYAYVVREITTTRMLVSRAFHHTEWNCSRKLDPREYIERGDWTRYCFGNPEKSKPALNSYVAHCPQSLNARTLNEAFMSVFYEVALPNLKDFRLHAQIHDSILFSYRIGFQHLATMVKTALEIPVTLRNIRGEYCTFTVPSALKLGKIGEDGKLTPAKYWSETE